MNLMKKFAGCLIISLLLVSCASGTQNLIKENIEKVNKGKTTKTDVEQLFGQPYKVLKSKHPKKTKNQIRKEFKYFSSRATHSCSTVSKDIGSDYPMEDAAFAIQNLRITKGIHELWFYEREVNPPLVFLWLVLSDLYKYGWGCFIFNEKGIVEDSIIAEKNEFTFF